MHVTDFYAEFAVVVYFKIIAKKKKKSVEIGTQRVKKKFSVISV